MVSTDWKSTELWQLLDARGEPAEETRHYLRSWLNDVQTILAKGETAPPDFTLHDEDHSFRVAQRMVDLMPDETITKLSDFELGLLLQSAYLHDIGMNPRRKIVVQIRDYLLSGFRAELSPLEAENLQRWLDESHPGTEPPIERGMAEVQRLHRADFLTAYFCRYRHNDWSEEFINEEAHTKGQAPYLDWLQDLILLCKSHHYHLQQLIDDQFNLRIAGSGNKLVNLRYLAAILRVADVLEFDPERTPEVIFTHREIDPKSRIYWYKDHNIVLALNEHKREILITARTRDAWGHRAVLETIDGVDFELQTCAAINDQGGFFKGVQLDGADHYKWIWPRRVATDVTPQRSSFVYIDGAFRPDAGRVLSLLTGTRLYHTPLVAFRELLQNAFDAVKEQMALEFLHSPYSSEYTTQTAHAHVHRVVLSMQQQERESWLICSDSGVGMTRRIIEGHLLVSGSRPRPELLELERHCASRGVKLDRSGEFGIGVLSYFMIGNKLVIETKSSPDAYRDNETHGWRFETDGIDGFGELRVLQRQQRGTTVHLRLRDPLRESLLQQVRDYLKNLLAKVPCPVDVGIGKWCETIEPGWVRRPVQYTDDLLEQSRLFGSGESMLSDRQKQRRAERKKRVSEVRSSAASKMRFFGPVESELSNKGGSFQVYLPYFALNDGPSLCFLDVSDGSLRPLVNGYYLSLSHVNQISWRAFQIAPDEDDSMTEDFMDLALPAQFLVQLDISHHGSISVDRDHLVIDSANQALIHAEVSSAAEGLFESFIAQHGSSVYCSLSSEWAARLSDENLKQNGTYWAQPLEEGGATGLYEWRATEFPTLVLMSGRQRRFGKAALRRSGINSQLTPLRSDMRGAKGGLFLGLFPIGSC